jgi:hypothetical protein
VPKEVEIPVTLHAATDPQVFFASCSRTHHDSSISLCLWGYKHWEGAQAKRPLSASPSPCSFAAVEMWIATGLQYTLRHEIRVLLIPL